MKTKCRGIKDFPTDDNGKQKQYNKLSILKKKNRLRIDSYPAIRSVGQNPEKNKELTSSYLVFFDVPTINMTSPADGHGNP